ncbi:glycosyltransferase involved in cell wall biosynthesis [Pedobacter cryoconitis]|uniref:glycosyltransferase family 4 protein n=1 Tax=Pedobacter cryoconitis TaxID=188932 RepID=UPI00161CBC90|nr:glycosyltransferase family 4 protein [Pedobacter cryoconitis]MBB6271529.1 glycosyltransferase involved in cell wall biosynthesis [Pedobacter cryoconitis]
MMSLNKNVLHVVNISFVLPYYIGDQFDYFADKGFRFYVACSPSDHLLEYSKVKKFTAVPVNIFRKIHPLADLKSILKLRSVIKSEQIDIVIGHTPKGAMIAMIAAYLAGVKIRIYFRHGLMYETSSGLKRFLLKKIENLTGGLASTVVCVSDSVLQKSNSENLNNPRKNILLNRGTCNGIDTMKFSKKNLDLNVVDSLKNKYGFDYDTKVLGYVGRLVKDKGINELIGAWKILIAKDPALKLLLVGPFEERDSVSDEIRDYITKETSIVHTGLIDDVRAFYGLMNIFVLPSYREGFPTVVLEASSMELPVITTRSTGCKDSILENETGMFSEIDANDLAFKIGQYLINNDLAVQHGENGRKFVLKNFRQELIWNEIENKLLNV